MIFMENYLCNFEQGLAEILSPPLGACGLCRPLQALITPPLQVLRVRSQASCLATLAAALLRAGGRGPESSAFLSNLIAVEDT